jgi:hypothetical protein
MLGMYMCMHVACISTVVYITGGTLTSWEAGFSLTGSYVTTGVQDVLLLKKEMCFVSDVCVLSY